MPYEFESRVRYSEVGVDKKLTLCSLVDYFQDCAIFQSEACGNGVDQLGAKGLAWLVLSWQIDVLRLPELGEKVYAQTWAYGFKAFYGYRNCALLDEGREYLARANSIWVLIDMKTGHPAKVSPEIYSLYRIEPRIEMENSSRKIPLPDDAEKQEPFTVGLQHLDTNRHVNNGQYIRMAEEYLPEGFRTKRFRVEYRQQAHLHDTIVPYVNREEDAVTVGLCDAEGKPYAIVRHEAGMKEDA